VDTSDLVDLYAFGRRPTTEQIRVAGAMETSQRRGLARVAVYTTVTIMARWEIKK
jgi:hypothetical protein